MDRVKILGLGVDTYSFEEAVELAERGQVVTLNPEMINYALKNEVFAKIIESAELVIPDGIGVQIGLKILGYDVKRIAGIEFAREMINKYDGQPIALVGAKPEIIRKTVENLKRENPDINLVYVQDGYFKDESKIINEIVEKQPKLVLAALGSPKQEMFIYNLKSKLSDTLMIGVGGSFDVWSGEVKRAPLIFQKFGLEWLYRTIKEPKRFKRIFPTLPMFILKVLRSKFC